MADLLCCMLQLFKLGVELPLKVVHRDSAATGRGLPAYVSMWLSSIVRECPIGPRSQGRWTIAYNSCVSASSGSELDFGWAAS
jgi:hypothetical protein